MAHQMRRLGFFLFFILASSSFSSASPASFEFALPELEGTISLGVYDSSGKLVRTLTKHASLFSFQIGLNGLIASWDGKTDEGNEAPAGKYEVRGFVAGPMKLEATKFHFNDWGENSDGPFPTAILSVFCTPRGGLVLLWNALGSDNPQLCYYSNLRSLQWVKNMNPLAPADPLSTPIMGPQESPLLVGVEGKRIFLIRDNRLLAFSLDNGSPQTPSISLPFPPTTACRKGATTLLAAEGKFAGITDSGANRPIASPDQEITGLFATSKGFLALTFQGTVYAWNKGSWHRVSLPIPAKKITPGYGETLWLVADSPEKEEYLGQFNLRGEFLRKIHLPSEEVTTCLAAPPDEDKVFLLRAKNDGSSYLAGYQFVKPSKRNATVCQEFFRKAIFPSSQFTFPPSEGHLSTFAPEIEISLAGDALNPEPRTVWLQAKTEGDTAWLATEDGLALLPIGKLPGLSRAILTKKAFSETPTLFLENGATVVEFSIQGITHLQPLDIGSISKD